MNLTGLYVPLITPFDRSGAVALDALASVAHQVLAAGARGVVALGTTGGHGQSQTVAQALVQMMVFGMSPQHAAEAPRFRSYDGLSLAGEARMPGLLLRQLEARGHELDVVEGWTAPFGNLHVIRREANGVLRAGVDMRREAAAIAY
jgi:gamma-glutamyltranspeptidase